MVGPARAREAVSRSRPAGRRVPGPQRGRARPDGHRPRAGPRRRDAGRDTDARAARRRHRAPHRHARVASAPAARRPRCPRPSWARSRSSDEASEVRAIVAAVASGLGLGATLHVGETDEAVTATLSGGELGVVIGKHGKTIDAVQYLVNAIRAREGDSKHVVIDAQNYRRRRELALRRDGGARGARRGPHRPARRARSDDQRRAQDRAPAAEGPRRRRDVQRRPRAVPPHRRQPGRQRPRPRPTSRKPPRPRSGR